MLRNLVPGLERTRHFPRLRNAYLRMFKPHYWNRYIHGFREFYRPFVSPGSLVFDIGANIGEYTDVFLHLGARVISVEPNPDLAQKLSLIRNKRMTLLRCAVGDKVGSLPMRLSSAHDGLGSLSDEWVNIAEHTERFIGHTWDRTVIVPVQTLDSLIEFYGVPDYVKIDVEGFELQTLSGLEILPKYLSFEFNGEWTAPTLECLQQPCFTKETRFNYVIEDLWSFVLPQWVSAPEMTRLVQDGFAKHKYGDIFARRA